MDLAVLYMLTGRQEDARRLLMEVQPVSQHPPVFANNQYAKFLDAFSRHFGLDLDLASWPVRERVDQALFGRINIRQNGVVRNALINIGRADLAGQAAGLSESELRRISDRSTEIFRDMPKNDMNLGRACGLAAAEFLDP